MTWVRPPSANRFRRSIACSFDLTVPVAVRAKVSCGHAVLHRTPPQRTVKRTAWIEIRCLRLQDLGHMVTPCGTQPCARVVRAYPELGSPHLALSAAGVRADRWDHGMVMTVKLEANLPPVR